MFFCHMSVVKYILFISNCPTIYETEYIKHYPTRNESKNNSIIQKLIIITKKRVSFEMRDYDDSV